MPAALHLLTDSDRIDRDRARAREILRTPLPEPAEGRDDDGVRVLFSTTAGAGHFGPLIPVARACAAAGWDVAVAAPSTFGDTVRGAGLDHLQFPDAPPEQMRAVFGGLVDMTPVEADRVVIADVFGRLDAQAALPAMITIMADWQPDLVVREPCEFGSLVAAERAGVPQAQVAIGMARLGRAFTELLRTHWPNSARRRACPRASPRPGSVSSTPCPRFRHRSMPPTSAC